MSREIFLISFCAGTRAAHLFETFGRLVSVIFLAQQTMKLTPNKTMVNTFSVLLSWTAATNILGQDGLPTFARKF